MKSSQNHSSGLTLFKHIKYEHLVAGVTGGVTSTVLLHPLDLLKIRFAGEETRIVLFLPSLLFQHEIVCARVLFEITIRRMYHHLIITVRVASSIRSYRIFHFIYYHPEVCLYEILTRVVSFISLQTKHVLLNDMNIAYLTFVLIKILS